jgi:hypothetical protein
MSEPEEGEHIDPNTAPADPRLVRVEWAVGHTPQEVADAVLSTQPGDPVADLLGSLREGHEAHANHVLEVIMTRPGGVEFLFALESSHATLTEWFVNRTAEDAAQVLLGLDTSTAAKILNRKYPSSPRKVRLIVDAMVAQNQQKAAVIQNAMDNPEAGEEKKP